MMHLLAADPLEHVLPHPIFGDHLTWFTNQSLMALIVGVGMILIFPSCSASLTAPHRPALRTSSNRSSNISALKCSARA